MKPFIWLSLSIIILFFWDASASTCRSPRSGIDLYLDHAPSQITRGENFGIYLSIQNNENTTQNISLYSYIYRGSKVYSTSRKSNLQNIAMEAEGSLSLELQNNATAPPGSYRLKVVLEYNTNKTKEITLPINLTENPAPKKLEISYLRLNQSDIPVIMAAINNTAAKGYDITLRLESASGFSERELFIGPQEEARLEFPIKASGEQNYFFLKLYQNSSLIDISELILGNLTVQMAAATPFSLVMGNLMLNSSGAAYSAAEKTRTVIFSLLLSASLILNLYLLFRKKSSP